MSAFPPRHDGMKVHLSHTEQQKDIGDLLATSIVHILYKIYCGRIVMCNAYTTYHGGMTVHLHDSTCIYL